jgi:hypothetical protein
MSRFLGGACCAVVALWGLVLFAQEAVDEKAVDPLAKFEHQSEPANAEERIETALNEQLRSPLDFTEIPLNEIINTLADEYDIPIVFDNAALDEVAISPEIEVTVNLRNVPLRSALNLILRQPGIEDLTYVIDENVLLITTKERADATLQVRMYRIDDLEMFADPPREGAQGWTDFTPLVRVITSCVEPDSWKQNDTGDGDIILIRPGVLVVAQTHMVHEKIEQVLGQLRAVKANFGSDPENVLGDSPAALAR